MSNETDFDNLKKIIQKNIDKEEEKIFSKKVLDEYRNPTNFGFIKNPDASAEKKGTCGDTMRLDLKIRDKIIYEARFWTDGCGASIACGNILTKIIKGKKIKDAYKMTNNQIIKALDGLPDENIHCSVLCVDTLKECLNKYLEKKKE